jgi:hypothetical protein
MTLAIAVASRDHHHLNLILRDLIANGPGHPVAQFDGDFDEASISWINNFAIAAALRRHPGDISDDDSSPPADGLQLIVVSGASSVAPITLPDCLMSRLSWSPHAVYAVGQGDSGAPPVIIDRKNRLCTRFHSATPILVLGWDPDTEGSFLYAATDAAGRITGVFTHDIATMAERPTSISTGAAAFTATGAILTIGNQKLTPFLAAQHPDQPVPAQIAIEQADRREVDIRQLGFMTTPAMLAGSTMAYSRADDAAAIQAFAPSLPVPWRKIVEYSNLRDSSFLLAQGPAKGTVTMSWSPKGQFLAILDGAADTGTAFALLAPPR